MIRFQDLIEKKRDGQTLSREEIEALVQGITRQTVPDYQISAWAMAVFFQGMSAEETRDLAVAMASSGDVMHLEGLEGLPVDKHSTGGVGDKTTLVAIPLVAAAGIPVVKMSGRGLGHTGGTIDKFESIPGFQVEKTLPEVIEQVNRVKAAVISQMGNLVPADKKLYAIRDVTATVDSVPLIASSVMSKKLAAGARGIVLDVKVGRGAFMKDREQASRLAETMVAIGRGAGRQVIAVLSDMSQPLGYAVGNALEVREAIETLMGKGPQDLEELSLHLAAHMIMLGGGASGFEEAWHKVTDLLASGAGLEAFMRMVEAQQGRLNLNSPDYGLSSAPVRIDLVNDRPGYIAGLDALNIGRAVMHLGAGRQQVGDVINPSVGVVLHKKIGDWVQPGESLATVHAENPPAAQRCGRELKEGIEWSAAVPRTSPLLLATLT